MSKKLLLADDSVTIQKVVELLLSDEDYEIKAVGNGEEALAMIKDYSPDIVLADIEMPGMNGYQLCEKIKNDETLAHIPVILLAGAFEPIDEDLAKEVKADDYLVKPFESQELISKLNAVMASKEIEEAAVSTPGEAEAVEEAAEVLTEGIEEAALETEAIEVAAPLEEIEELEELEEALETEPSGSEEAWFSDEEPSQPEEEQGSPAEEPPAFEEEAPPAEEPPATMETEETTTEEHTAEEPVEPPVSEEVSVSAPEPTVEMKIEPPSPEEVSRIIENKIDESLSGIFGQLTSQGLEEMVQQRIDNVITETIASLNINTAIERAAEESLKTAIERLAAEKIPQVIEESIKATVTELSDSLKQQVEKIIWETVPDLAETIITKEIEKIKATF